MRQVSYVKSITMIHFIHVIEAKVFRSQKAVSNNNHFELTVYLQAFQAACIYHDHFIN